MNWKIRAHALALLSRLPAGEKLYHSIQKSYRMKGFNGKVPTERALEIIRLIQESGGRIEDSVVVEIGTGWRPVLPYIFYLLGAKRIDTYDLNPWLSHDYALDTWRAMKGNLESIAAISGRSVSDLKAAYEAVNPEGLGFAEMLRQLRITYKSPANFEENGIQDDSVDFVVSSNVLEHIPADVLSRIHLESYRILRKTGLSVHRFNPQDHFSEVDAAISNINFLRFSDKQWHWYGGSGLAYHNRLRSSDHKKIFEGAGFEMRLYENRIDAKSLELLKKGSFPLDSQFQSYSHEDLAADYVWAVGRKA